MQVVLVPHDRIEFRLVSVVQLIIVLCGHDDHFGMSNSSKGKLQKSLSLVWNVFIVCLQVPCALIPQHVYGKCIWCYADEFHDCPSIISVKCYGMWEDEVWYCISIWCRAWKKIWCPLMTEAPCKDTVYNIHRFSIKRLQSIWKRC